MRSIHCPVPWEQNNGFAPQCDVIWGEQYALLIYKGGHYNAFGWEITIIDINKRGINQNVATNIQNTPNKTLSG
jgi:hypothetical protein